MEHYGWKEIRISKRGTSLVLRTRKGKATNLFIMGKNNHDP